MSETSALLDLIASPLERSICVVTATSPLTITFHGQTGVLAEKIAGSTVTTGNAYVLFTRGRASKPLVFQTVTS
jgi:hypothetical protein